ncbi:MAG: BrnT family toxin [Chloroflexota bacterium]
MHINEVLWLPDFEEKISDKHRLETDEVEEALFSEPHVRFVEKGYRPNENLYAAYGNSDAGRYIIVFFILKPDRRALVISARDMDEKEKRHYGKRR